MVQDEEHKVSGFVLLLGFLFFFIDLACAICQPWMTESGFIKGGREAHRLVGVTSCIEIGIRLGRKGRTIQRCLFIMFLNFMLCLLAFDMLPCNPL